MASMFRFLLVCMKLLLVVALGWGCSAQADNQDGAYQSVTIQLKWLHQFQFAGYYAAIEKGFYRDEGLEVRLRERDPATSGVDDVLKGTAQYGVSDTGLVLPRLQGKPVVLLAQVFQHSPLVFLTLRESGIRSPYDLRGKRVTVDIGGFRYAPLDAMLYDTLGGIGSIEATPMSFRHQDLLEDKIDAFTAYITDQPYWFQERGIEVNIIDPRNYGIDYYGDNFYTTEEELESHPQRVRAMLRASLRGWRYALANQQEIVDLILRKYNSQGLSREHLLYEARETAKMILPDHVELGSYEATRYRKNTETFARLGLVDQIEIDKDFFYDPNPYGLTDAELEYLATLPPLKLPLIEHQPPLTYLNNDQAAGYLNELSELVAKRLAIRVERISGLNYLESVNALQKGQVDWLNDYSEYGPKRQSIIQTRPVLSVPFVVVGRKSSDTSIRNLDDLKDKKLVMVKGFQQTRTIINSYPDWQFETVANLDEAYRRLRTGEADYYIDNVTHAGYYLERHIISDLKIVGQLPVEEMGNLELRFAVTENRPLLLSAIQKVLNAINKSELAGLRRKWLTEYDAVAPLQLSEREKLWIENHPIVRVYADPSTAPIEYRDEYGEFRGISIDYLAQLEKLLGIEFVVAHDISPQKLADAIKGKRVDMLSSSVLKADYFPILNFSKPYLEIPYRIYSRDDVAYIGGVNNLVGKKVVTIEDRQLEKRLEEVGFELDLTRVATIEEGLNQVIKGSADAFIGNILSTNYYLGRHDIRSLRIAGETPYLFNQHYAVRKDWPELFSILQKGLNTLTNREHQKILSRWMSIEFTHEYNYRLFWQVLIVGLVILFAILYWNRRLALEVRQRMRAESELRHQQIFLEQRVEERTQELKKINEALQHEINDRERYEKQLIHQAQHDILTGLPNRLLFDERLKQSVRQAKRHQSGLAVVFVDLDRFKYINDTLGHAAGDEMLIQITHRLRESIRESDTVARISGDEFMVLLEEISPHGDDVHLVISKLMNAFKTPFNIFNNEVRMTASLGISLYPQDGDDAETMMKNADVAMYQAKDEGRNTFEFYNRKMSQDAQEQVFIENALQSALQLDEFTLMYQPQLDIKKKRFIGMEVLIRWHHSEHGFISPARFIPVAEMNGQIKDIGAWVLRQACLQAVKWIEKGMEFEHVSVNVSGQQVQDAQFVAIVESVVRETGMSVNKLELEVTESFVADRTEVGINQLNELHKLGVSIAIDDFGTGYSSLSYLKQLPIDKIKIDQSFIRDIPADSNDMAITEAIIAMSRALQLDVIAEGVETEEQAQFLLDRGCYHAQGYLYSRPVPSNQIETLFNLKN